MPKIAYINRNFSAATLAVIVRANRIIAEYLQDGYQLTLRQLYYQFVARGFIPNRQSEYKRLGSIVNDARLAGMIDWSAIEDRGRELQTISSWSSPSSIIDAAARSYQVDMWENQEFYVECWVEKEALLGVIAVPCEKWRVPHFACKGYTSQSALWEAGHGRFRQMTHKRLLVLHLGDHDPSGIDMTRDVRERLEMFTGGPVEVRRLALNMPQVEEWQPPPNPAKATDSRFNGYADLYGEESWELDALPPTTLGALIEENIESALDAEQWREDGRREEEGRDALAAIAERFDDVAAWVADQDGE